MSTAQAQQRLPATLPHAKTWHPTAVTHSIHEGPCRRTEASLCWKTQAFSAKVPELAMAPPFCARCEHSTGSATPASDAAMPGHAWR